MRNLGLLLVTTTSIACGSPEGSMLDTDGSSGTDGSSDSSDGVSVSSASASATMTAGMTSSESDPTASSTNSTAPTTSMTTGDPDSSGTDDDTSTGDCPPGELDCPCDIGSTCSGELFCEDGTCVAEPSCDEPEGEPNDDEASAVELPGVTCGAAAMTVAGAFDGAESDWFRFEATDAIACFTEPRVAVTASAGIGVCLFIDCGDGNGTANCSGPPTDETSPEGLEGCCAQDDLTLDFSCGLGFPPPSVTVLARLTSIEAACLPYELEFAY